MVHRDGELDPLEPESYIELEGMLKLFQYVCGQGQDIGYLDSGDCEAQQHAERGSVVFDIKSDWYNRELWCLNITTRRGGRGPKDYDYGLALEPIHQDLKQPPNTASAASGPDGHAPGECDNLSRTDDAIPGCFRRLGLARLTQADQSEETSQSETDREQTTTEGPRGSETREEQSNPEPEQSNPEEEESEVQGLESNTAGQVELLKCYSELIREGFQLRRIRLY